MLVRKKGLEPSRGKPTQEPESCSSANSDISAYDIDITNANIFEHAMIILLVKHISVNDILEKY